MYSTYLFSYIFGKKSLSANYLVFYIKECPEIVLQEKKSKCLVIHCISKHTKTSESMRPHTRNRF